MLSPQALVIRDGRRHEIDAADLVPGDRVVLSSGDRAPADIRLVSVKELRVDESALTGVVLADDNFATIAVAVREGRAVYDNLKKFILFMLPTNGGEALVVIAAILFELALPLTPAQVLWINMVTSSTLGLALAFEPAEHGIMNRRPRPPGEALLSGFFVWRVLLVSVLMMTGALGLFLWELNNGVGIETVRTMAVNAVVVAEMFYLINSRYLLPCARGHLGRTDRESLRSARHRRLYPVANRLHPRPGHAGHFRLDAPVVVGMEQSAGRRAIGVCHCRTGKTRDSARPPGCALRLRLSSAAMGQNKI